MSSKTESMADYNPTSLLAGFNRHGLPGLVIGVLFLYLAGGFWLGLRALSANTDATAAVAVAMNRLANAIEKESKNQ